VWTDDTRADAGAFLQVTVCSSTAFSSMRFLYCRCECVVVVQGEWALVDEWLSSHPGEPFAHRGGSVTERMSRPSLDRALCVGGVFVRPFNAQPRTKDVELLPFCAALADRLSACTSALFAAPAARGATLTSDTVDVITALQSAWSVLADSRSDAAPNDELAAAVVTAVLSCLHAALPSSVVFSGVF
jgi:hypothetical protein